MFLKCSTYCRPIADIIVLTMLWPAFFLKPGRPPLWMSEALLQSQSNCHHNLGFKWSTWWPHCVIQGTWHDRGPWAKPHEGPQHFSGSQICMYSHQQTLKNVLNICLQHHRNARHIEKLQCCKNISSTMVAILRLIAFQTGCCNVQTRCRARENDIQSEHTDGLTCPGEKSDLQEGYMSEFMRCL